MAQKAFRVGWKTLRETAERLDGLFVAQLRSRATLIAVLIGLFLLGWGAWENDYILDTEVLLAGATGYVLGFAPAVAIGVIATLLQWTMLGVGADHPSASVLQFLGCSYIAWLGREHHRITRERQVMLSGIHHDQRIIPWSLVNEVRNSLLAMRLLLFDRKRVDVDPTPIELVEEELLRLESIFGNLSKDRAAEGDKRS